MYQSPEFSTAPEEHKSIVINPKRSKERNSPMCDERVETPMLRTSINILSGQAVGAHSEASSIPFTDANVMEKLQTWLTTNELSRLQLEFGLDTLWSASREPPITKSSLSELDIKKTINNAKLRHDLNFDRDIAFRPNSDGSRGQEKVREARRYWEALSIEFAIYIARKNHIRITAAQTRSPSLSDPSHRPDIPYRLPKMFETLHEILKTLVPGPEWSAVDQRLDVDLLMQELGNGVCDLIGLSEWLGELLQGSCSPMRDQSVLQMVHSIQEAVHTDDARGLVGGLRNLFGVLETMKLVCLVTP